MKQQVLIKNKAKNVFLTFVLILLLGTIEFKAQTITYSVTPPSCATCCDGSFTMATSSTYLIRNITPTLNVQSVNYHWWFFTKVCAGNYQIEMAPLCGENHMEYFSMPVPTGVSSVSSNQNTNEMFPNPAQDFVNFKIEVTGNKKVSIVITDLTGSFVKEVNSVNPDTYLNISDFKTGFYFVNILSGGKVIETKRLLVTK